MANYYLGVDVGGTKSDALITNRQGELLGHARAGGGNPDTVGMQGLKNVLHEIIGGALNQAGLPIEALSAAGFGIAGFDWEIQRQPILKMIGAAGLPLTTPLRLVNDAVLGIVAGSENGIGVALVSGTGCNCWGRDASGREGHAIGHGSDWDEGAGAYEIVARALVMVGKAYTRRSKPTSLTEKFVRYSGASSAEDLISGITQQRYEIDSRAAPLVWQAAQEGDEVANAVFTWAGKSLGDLALGVIRQLDLQKSAFDVVLIGSMFNIASDKLIDPIKDIILREAAAARFVPLNIRPVAGAVLLAMEAANHLPAPGVKQLLFDSSKRTIK